MTSGWAAVVIAVAVAVAALAAWFGRWLVRLLIGTFKFIYVEWPHVAESIDGLRTEIAVIKRETQPNDGRSLRDVIQRIREDVTDVKQEQAAVRRELFKHQKDETTVVRQPPVQRKRNPPAGKT